MQLAFRPSIWLKLAIFVGVLVVLASGVLIWTAYLFARDMLVDQIHERLTVTASDRQAMLLAYIHQQGDKVKLGGPFLDADGQMAGSMILLEADSLEAAQAFHASDPYKLAGLFERSEVRPWRLTTGAWGPKS